MIPTPSPRHLRHDRQFRLIERAVFKLSRRHVPDHKLDRFLAIHNDANPDNPIVLDRDDVEYAIKRRRVESALLSAWKEWY